MENQNAVQQANQNEEKEYVWVNVPKGFTRPTKLDGVGEQAVNVVIPPNTTVNGFMRDEEGNPFEMAGVNIGGGTFLSRYPVTQNRDGSERNDVASRFIKGQAVLVNYPAGQGEYNKIYVDPTVLNQAIRNSVQAYQREHSVWINIPSPEAIQTRTNGQTGQEFQFVQLPYKSSITVDGHTYDVSDASFSITKGMYVKESEKAVGIRVPENYEISLRVLNRGDDGKVQRNADGNYQTTILKVKPQDLATSMDNLVASRREYAQQKQQEQAAPTQQAQQASPSLGSVIEDAANMVSAPGETYAPEDIQF